MAEVLYVENFTVNIEQSANYKFAILTSIECLSSKSRTSEWSKVTDYIVYFGANFHDFTIKHQKNR